MVGEFSVADVGVELAVLNNGRDLLGEYFAIIDGLAWLRFEKLARLVEPSIVGRFLDAVEREENVNAEVRASKVELYVGNNERAFLGRDYL